MTATPPAAGAQLAALQEAVRSVAAAASSAAIRQAVHDAVPLILPVGSCYTFEVRADGPVLESTGESLDQSLVSQAIASGEVCIAPTLYAPTLCALCAPIKRNGKVVACFYVTHCDIDGVFDDQERQLAGFVAEVAGATLEHEAGSEAHFRALVRNAHDLTIVTDPTGRALYVSPSITRILGYAPAEMTRLDGHLLHPDDRQTVINAFRLCRFSPATRPMVELRARHADGSWRWLEVTLSNLLADESIRGIVFNIRDTTDRKSAELAMSNSAEQFRLSFENAPIGMAVTSTDQASEGWLLRVNQALADMLGYTREDLEGRTVAQLTHPDDQAADEAAMVRFQHNEATSFATEKRYRHADGRWIWVHLQTSMVSGSDGPPKYVISQMVDITERRAAEEQLTFLALHDPLTGLANRRLLLDRLTMALARAARSGRMVAVLYLDLDRFKEVNDSFGHEQGDQLLLMAASRLEVLVRDTDTLARLGGDEFVLVADDLASSAQALAIARRIEEAFARPFELSSDLRLSIGASVGVALAGDGADAVDGVDGKTLLRHADAAMYQAKDRGRGCYQLFDTGSDAGGR
jgi:diguanylate cyclase (GGDEF)-like protein/PAS domain S-box-containing protein